MPKGAADSLCMDASLFSVKQGEAVPIDEKPK